MTLAETQVHKQELGLTSPKEKFDKRFLTIWTAVRTEILLVRICDDIFPLISPPQVATATPLATSTGRSKTALFSAAEAWFEPPRRQQKPKLFRFTSWLDKRNPAVGSAAASGRCCRRRGRTGALAKAQKTALVTSAVISRKMR